MRLEKELGVREMRKFKSSIYEEIQRVKKNGALPPLRTLKEMANEFGVSPATLRGLIAKRNGPDAVLKVNGSATVRNTWFEPKELRKWWLESVVNAGRNLINGA